MNLAIVIPAYNEDKIIEKLLYKIEEVLDVTITFVLIDDCSCDQTFAVCKNYSPIKKSTRKKIVSLSRNFGHQRALMAGLSQIPEYCDTILVMDADFQDNPEDISKLLDKYTSGYDCVYGVRYAKSGSFFINLLTKFFYQLQKHMLSFYIPPHAGTFSVFSREFLSHILEFKESEIYFPGIRAYIGMKQEGVHLVRGNRLDGKSKVGFSGLLNLSTAGLIGFSAVPMRIIFLIGLLLTSVCFSLSAVVLGLKLFGVTKIPGVTTVLLIILGLFGLQFMFTGVVGEYIGKLFYEIKRRPIWIIKDSIDE